MATAKFGSGSTDGHSSSKPARSAAKKTPYAAPMTTMRGRAG
jgi:hypothetical protein